MQRVNEILTNSAKTVILISFNGQMRTERRVEIHVRVDDDGITTMLAYSGTGQEPDRAMQQGPYQRLDEAIGARRAILIELIGQGYQISQDAVPIWSLQAQRDIKQMRTIKEASDASYSFDPKDVFFD